MLPSFNKLTRAAVAGFAFASLAGATNPALAQNTAGNAWWLKSGVLPPASQLRMREVEVNVRGFTGMVHRERQCEINGVALPANSGIIPDTGHFYAVPSEGQQRICDLIPLVSLTPRNPATAQELMTEIASRAPNVAAVLQGRPATGFAALNDIYAPKAVPGVGIFVPPETTMGYMLMASLNGQAQRAGFPTANPCASTGPDTDGDGIPDSVERQGAVDLDGTRFRSNPAKEDSDDDGLTDGDEIGEPLDFATAQQRAIERGLNPGALNPQVCYYDVYSNPLERDTDNDLLEDWLELKQGSDPRKTDTDGDGLSDAGERLWGTDPRNKDTDGDGFSDDYEKDNENLGFNPLVYNRPLMKQAYLKLVEAGAQAVKGGVCGDICDLDTLPELVGAMAFSVVPGVGTAADLRDVFANTIKGNFVNAALSATGVVPLGGDATRLGNMATSFLRRHPEQLEPVLQIISKADFIPDTMRASVLRKTFTGAAEATFHGLTFRHGISEKTVMRLSRNTRNMKLRELLKVLDECGNCIRRDVAGFSNDGWMRTPMDAEKHLRQGRTRPGALPPPPRKRTDVRFYDDMHSKVAGESKTGYAVAGDNRVLKQIEKDCAMKANVFARVDEVEWHFYASDASSSIGAAVDVIQALKNCKNGPIPFYFHMP